MSVFAVVLTVFGATALEMVEALTIVLAVGIGSGWRPALTGAGIAIVVLALALALGGVALILAVPIRVLRIVAGFLLLWFGRAWLVKAIRRASGLKPKRDEAAAFSRIVSATKRQVALATSFKGVLLEGFEAALFAVTIGSTSQRMTVAALSALSAVVIVGAVGVVVHRPLTKVPENAIAFVVGIALVSFGIFWLGEGAGVQWPGADAALLGIAAVVAASSTVAVSVLQKPRSTQQ